MTTRSATVINFPTINFFEDGESNGEIPLMTSHSVSKLVTEHLVDPDESVLSDNQVKICFSYPFAQDFVFTFNSKSGNGFTRGELVSLIINQYYTMYREEEETSPDPILTHDERITHQGGLMNRNKTSGKYGIWGHDMSDLSLNSMELDSGGIWHLSIDS